MADFIIHCPNCNHQFEPGDSIREEVQKELRGQMVDWQKKKDEEFRQKEQALKTKEEELELSLQRQLIEEREKIKEQLSKEEAEKLSIKEQEYQLLSLIHISSPRDRQKSRMPSSA